MNLNDFTASASSAIKTLQEAKMIIESWHDRLKVRESELNERENKVAKREKSVLDCQKLAANRKTEIKVLVDNLAQENELRKKANGDASTLRQIVKRLEAEIARLLAEKKTTPV